MTFTLEVQELRRPTVVHSLTVKWSNTIRDIKCMINALVKFPPSRMQLLRSANSAPIADSKTLGGIGIDRAGHTLVVSLHFSANPQHTLDPVPGIPLDAECKDMVTQVRLGLNANQVPAKTDMLDCTGGVYFMKSAQGNLTAVFKPQDEEQGMPNNPKGHAGLGGEGLRSYIKPGDGHLHEVAAYLLDYRNFCQVPPTVIVHCEHPSFNYSSTQRGGLGMFPKIGSLQKYIRAGDTFEDISPSLIGTLELQKIALLDIRLLNCDRNASNILAIRKPVPNTFNNGVRPRRGSRSGSELSWTDELDDVEVDLEDFLDESQNRSGKHSEDMYELIPIDHGYCFPTKLLIEDFDWAWFHCPQIAKPVDPAIKEYVASLDIDAMLKDLRSKIELPEESLFLLKVVHQVLVEGIARGLTLRDIAGLIARTEEGKPSPVEKLIKSAEDNALRALEIRKHGTTMKSPPARRSPVTVMHSVAVPSPSRSTESVSLRRMINSELFLNHLAGGDSETTTSATGRGPSSVAASKIGKEGIAYLSGENIQKLQNSPDVGKRQKGGLLLAPHRTDSPGADYFMKDLDPQFQSESGAPARPLRSVAGPGDPITQLRSFDSFRPAAEQRLNSYLTGSWLQSADGDITSSEASLSDLGSSPRFSTFENCLRSPLVNSTDSSGTASSTTPAICVGSPEELSAPPVRRSASGKQMRQGKRRHRSDTTTTDDERGDDESEGSSSSDLAPEAPALTRVASFTALNSPPLYDEENKSSRQLGLLKRSRERGVTRSSTEYITRRFDFASAAVEQLVTKVKATW